MLVIQKVRKRKEEEKEKREKEEEGEKEKEEGRSKKGGQEGGKVKARILWASHTLSTSTLDSFFTNPHAWSLEHVLLEEYNADSRRSASILELGAEDVVLLDTNLMLSSSFISGEMQASLSSIASTRSAHSGGSIVGNVSKHLSPFLEESGAPRTQRQAGFTMKDSGSYKVLFLPLSINVRKLLPAINKLTRSACRWSQDHLPIEGMHIPLGRIRAKIWKAFTLDGWLIRAKWPSPALTEHSSLSPHAVL